MGAPRARGAPDLVTGGRRPGGSAAAVIDFAVAQILRDDTALGALPAVLGRLADAFGLRAALAFQPSSAQSPTVLGVHPPGAVDPELLARIGALTRSQREGVAAPVQLRLEPDGPEASVLLAYSVPVGGRCLCALALIGDAPSWDEEVRATAHAVAAMVATLIRHANDLAKLDERRALTQALIDGAPIAILAMDAEGRLVEFNPAAESLSGYRREEVLGQRMSEFLVPERDRPRFHEHIQTYVTTGDPEEFTGQLRISTLHADGTERTVELTPVQITIGGEPVFTGFLRDLTEIERSHAALADQTERLNCLIASAMPGILITDEQGTVTNISQSFVAMFGLDEPADLAVRHVRPVDHAPHRARVRRPRRVHPAGHGGSPRPAADDRGADAVYRRPHPRIRLLAGARGRPVPR